MAAKTTTERQIALRKRRERSGWVRAEVWVPRDAVPRLRAYVKRLTGSGSGGAGKLQARLAQAEAVLRDVQRGNAHIWQQNRVSDYFRQFESDN